jgi:hypothetical protein
MPGQQAESKISAAEKRLTLAELAGKINIV